MTAYGPQGSRQSFPGGFQNFVPGTQGGVSTGGFIEGIAIVP